VVVGIRRYEELWAERTNARAEFRARHPRRNGRRMIPYPTELEALPTFAQWFRTEIETMKQAAISIPEDVEDSSILPSLQAQRFKSMYAYGYHYRVKSAEESITKTCDSGVAAFFRRPCRSGRRDANVVDANLEYIGQILEIVELNYGRHCTVLLVCDWVKANYRGRNATVRKDEWGFTLANFNTMVPFGYESFAFPVHCDQVFFSDVEDEPGWRVVLRTEVRGRRIDNNIEEEDVNPMFDMGADVDFEGLRAPDVIPETHPDPLPTGRNIRLNDILNEVLGEQSLVFDRDVGESSEEDE
jgi:hypothetical protein